MTFRSLSRGSASLRRFAVAAAFVVAGLALQAEDPKQPVLLARIDGVINPVVADYVKRAVREAERERAAAVLIELNTPGGLLDATRSLVEAMLNTTVPVIVYVSPPGARATSAGVFITMAADVAAMAPGTHIGAAHPVTLTGGGPRRSRNGEDGEDGATMEEKMASDAAAYIRAIAQEKGRNVLWAERAVRESVSLTASEALEQSVVDVVAENREDLLGRIHRRPVPKRGDLTVVLDVKGAPIRPFTLSVFQRFLHSIAHPNVAYVLLMLGIYGLIYEFASPGVGVGGVAGVICLLLAFFSLQVLPVNLVGVLLILFGIGLLLAELFTPTYGLLSLGGLAALFFGSFMLIDVRPGAPFPRVSLWLILPTVGLTALLVLVGVKKALGARKRPAQTGAEHLVGASATAKTELAPRGLVFLEGELWTAIAEDTVAPGETVTVVSHEGNVLKVRK